MIKRQTDDGQPVGLFGFIDSGDMVAWAIRRHASFTLGEQPEIEDVTPGWPLLRLEVRFEGGTWGQWTPFAPSAGPDVMGSALLHGIYEAWRGVEVWEGVRRLLAGLDSPFYQRLTSGDQEPASGDWLKAFRRRHPERMSRQAIRAALEAIRDKKPHAVIGFRLMDFILDQAKCKS